MVSSWTLLLVSVGYAALLFAVAWWGDRRPLYPNRPWLRPVVYSLALAVYCSSWTFYGAVGSAVRNGLGYLPIYLGPLLLLLFGWRIIERLALIARSEALGEGRSAGFEGMFASRTETDTPHVPERSARRPASSRTVVPRLRALVSFEAPASAPATR